MNTHTDTAEGNIHYYTKNATKAFRLNTTFYFVIIKD